jgi:hypothetical protein
MSIMIYIRQYDHRIQDESNSCKTKHYSNVIFLWCVLHLTWIHVWSRETQYIVENVVPNVGDNSFELIQGLVFMFLQLCQHQIDKSSGFKSGELGCRSTHRFPNSRSPAFKFPIVNSSKL